MPAAHSVKAMWHNSRSSGTAYIVGYIGRVLSYSQPSIMFTLSIYGRCPTVHFYTSGHVKYHSMQMLDFKLKEQRNSFTLIPPADTIFENARDRIQCRKASMNEYE